MCFCINCEVQLSPYTTLLFGVLFYFPLSLTKDFQTRGTNHVICYFTSGGCFKADINRLSSFASTGVIRAAQEMSIRAKLLAPVI